MALNRSQMNAAETEVIWCSSSRCRHQVPGNLFDVSSDVIEPVDHVPNLGLDVDSVENGQLFVPRTRTTYGDRVFEVAGPRMWNSLPPAVRSSTTLSVFKKELKTFLFRRADNCL